ncbi:endonuclease/exonuclease/phosphatase family protein [Ignatzschineria sp. LJL83]
MTQVSLKVASCNLQNLNEHSPAHKIDNFILALENELQFPDIIALQEIGSGIIDEHQRAIAYIATTLTEQIAIKTGIHYHYVDVAPLQNSTGGARDVNIRSGFLLKADLILIDTKEIGIGHPAFIGDSTQDLKASRYPLVITIEKENQKITFINCHLKSQNSQTNRDKKLAKKQRNLQAQVIQDFCGQHSAQEQLVILGDFNDTPNSDTLKIITNELFHSIWKNYPHKLYTTKHRNCPIVLDFILLPDNISFQNPQAHHLNTNLKYPYRFSDHDPISVEITI